LSSVYYTLESVLLKLLFSEQLEKVFRESLSNCFTIYVYLLGEPRWKLSKQCHLLYKTWYH
jgi:hypothetical protein